MSLSRLQFGQIETSARSGSLMDREKSKRQYTLELAENEKKILRALNEQRKQDGAKCEVILLANGQKHFAHRIVLESCSDYLRQRLNEESDVAITNRSKTKPQKDGGPQTSIILPGITSEELDAVLEFMYTSRIVLEPGNVNEILLIGCLLQVQSIIELCASVLLKHPSWRSSLVTPEIANYGKREWESKKSARKHGKSTSQPTNIRSSTYDAMSKSGLTIPYILEAPFKNETFKRGISCVEKKSDGISQKARFATYQGDQRKGDSDVPIANRVSDLPRRRTPTFYSTDSAGPEQRGGKRHKLRESNETLAERKREGSGPNRGPPSLIPHSHVDPLRTQQEVLDLRRHRYVQNRSGYNNDEKSKINRSKRAYVSNANEAMFHMMSAIPSELYKCTNGVYGDRKTVSSYGMSNLTHPAFATNFGLAGEVYNRKQQAHAVVPQVGIDSFVGDYSGVIGIPIPSATSKTNYQFLLPTYSSQIRCQESLITNLPRHAKGGYKYPASVKRHSQNRQDFMSFQPQLFSEDFHLPIPPNAGKSGRKPPIQEDENPKAALWKSVEIIKEDRTEETGRVVDLIEEKTEEYSSLEQPVYPAPLTAKSEPKHEVSSTDLLYNAYSDAHRRKRKLLSGTQSYDNPTLPHKKTLLESSMKCCVDQNHEHAYLSKGHKYSSEDDVIARDCLNTELSEPESDDSGRPSSV